jgi:integrase
MLTCPNANTKKKCTLYSKWYTFFELLLGTGLRPSEALALTWRDIRLEKSLLTVTKKLSRKNKMDWSFDDPKSKKGRRNVSLPSSLVSLLSDHKMQQTKSRLENPHNLVVPAIDGLPANENCINRDTFKTLIKKAGLPHHIRLYDLRHTHATLLLLASVHPKIVSERLGHSTIAITLDTYSHVLPNMQVEVGEKLESVLYQSVAVATTKAVNKVKN